MVTFVALMFSVMAALPPLESVGEAGSGLQRTPDAAEQLRLTAPANPFTELRLMVSVAVPLEGTSMIVVSGTMLKSESGLEIGGVSVIADGAYVLLSLIHI